MDNLISIIVPVYNVEEYVERCIDSIITQTYTNIEIIIVDDGSIDSSSQIVDEIAHKDQRIIVVHQKNGGLSAARNTGIDIAKGRFIIFVDSDDFISNSMVEVLYNNIIEYNADLSVCDYYICENGVIPNDKTNNDVTCFEENILSRIYEDDRRSIVAWNKLYKADLFKQLRYPVGRLHEDEFVIQHILSQCKRVVYTEKKLYYYIIRSGSIMNNKSPQNALDGLAAACMRLSWANNYRDKSFTNGCFNVMINEGNSSLELFNIEGYKKFLFDVKSMVLKTLKILNLNHISKRKVLIGYLWIKNPRFSKTLRRIIHC